MNKFLIYRYIAILIVIIIGLSAIIYFLVKINTKPSLNDIPTIQTKDVSPVSTGQVYSNLEVGLSFVYPQGYFVIEEPTIKRIDIQNSPQHPTGVSEDPSFRVVSIRWSALDDLGEDVSKKRTSVVEESIDISGSTARLYTYPNPVDSQVSIAEAFWNKDGVYYSLAMPWDKVSLSPSEKITEMEESDLIKKILPTIFMK